MSARRTLRIASRIRQILSEIILREIKDPRVHSGSILTITHVEVTPDLGLAHVYFTITASQEQVDPDQVLAGLASAEPFLRKQIGQKLEIRRVPELKFSLDDTIERAWRLEEKLAEIKKEHVDEELVRPSSFSGQSPSSIKGEPDDR